MAAVTIIKLTGENYRDIDAVASQITFVITAASAPWANSTTNKASCVPVRKAPMAREETYDHWRCEFTSVF